MTKKRTDNERKLILASSSPQRRRLLEKGGYRFDVVVPTLGEPDSAFDGLPPAQQAEALAYFKARTVFDERPGVYVLGADTIVSVKGRVLGKPADRAEAEQMLRTLSGSRHEVITGVALLAPGGNRLIASDVTIVVLRALGDRELCDYLDSDEWREKAGAYAIQETGDRLVERLEGSLSNVIGLPMERVDRMMEKMGIRPALPRCP